MDILERLDRVESELALRALPARYALFVDSRDIDQLVELFSESVDMGGYGTGPDGVRAAFTAMLATFYRSVHFTGGHAIDFQDADHADGWLYSRAEHETGSGWQVMDVCYRDSYVREAGRWLFAKRRLQHWYCADVLERPSGPRWVDFDPTGRHLARLPQIWPTWATFWAAVDDDVIDALTDHP
jgi:hypothetical protein